MDLEASAIEEGRKFFQDCRTLLTILEVKLHFGPVFATRQHFLDFLEQLLGVFVRADVAWL